MEVKLCKFSGISAINTGHEVRTRAFPVSVHFLCVSVFSRTSGGARGGPEQPAGFGFWGWNPGPTAAPRHPPAGWLHVQTDLEVAGVPSRRLRLHGRHLAAAQSRGDEQREGLLLLHGVVRVGLPGLGGRRRGRREERTRHGEQGRRRRRRARASREPPWAPASLSPPAPGARGLRGGVGGRKSPQGPRQLPARAATRPQAQPEPRRPPETARGPAGLPRPRGPPRAGAARDGAARAGSLTATASPSAGPAPREGALLYENRGWNRELRPQNPLDGEGRHRAPGSAPTGPRVVNG